MRRRVLALRFAAAAAIVFVLAACTSRYSTLLADRDAPEFARLLDAGDALPSHVVRVEVEKSGDDPVRLAVDERGTGRDRVVVFIHGVFSDHRMWRFVVGDVGRDHDLMLVDLPGCGDSDCPEPGTCGSDDYCTTSLGRCVLTALRDRLKDRAPNVKVTLVGHSLGGTIVLRMLGDADLRREFADVRSHVDTAVIFSAVDFAMTKPDPDFKRLASVSAFEIAIGDTLGMVRGQLTDVFAAARPDPGIPLKEEVDRTYEHLVIGRKRRASQAMLREAVPFDGDDHPRWDRVEQLVADYANVDVPCLIVWGARDESMPQSMGYKLAAQLPNARLRVVPRTTHSLPTERPTTCAELIRTFADSAGRTVSDAGGPTERRNTAATTPSGEAR